MNSYVNDSSAFKRWYMYWLYAFSAYMFGKHWFGELHVQVHLRDFFLCNINRYEGLQLIFFITTAGKDKQWKSTAWEGGPWSDDAVSGKKGQCTGILVMKTTSNKCLIVIPWEKNHYNCSSQVKFQSYMVYI